MVHFSIAFLDGFHLLSQFHKLRIELHEATLCRKPRAKPNENDSFLQKSYLKLLGVSQQVCLHFIAHEDVPTRVQPLPLVLHVAHREHNQNEQSGKYQ